MHQPLHPETSSPVKKLVVLSGAGISAESGIKTFRASDGLWEEHDVHQIASPEGWAANPQLVLEFYNQRRRDVLAARPNAGHLALPRLEEKYDVQIITQNIDDLHERAMSINVLHLHGEILKSRSVFDDSTLFPCTSNLNIGDRAPDGGQLRPHVVWFGEAVPAMDIAYPLVAACNILIVVGTSLAVYPAANLIHAIKDNCSVYVVDPNSPLQDSEHTEIIQEEAGIALPNLVERLLA